MKTPRLFALALLVLVTACTSVDTTEWCVGTRYGKVTEERASVGLNASFLTDYTCFPLTDQNFPADGEVEKMEVQTSDPVTLTVDVSAVYAYDPQTVYQLFLAKRNDEAIRAEVLNSIREGVRNAFASWSVAEVFSAERANLSDSVKAHVQRKVGSRASVRNMYVRNLTAPPSIEQARTAAARQAQVLDQARKQSMIDSVNAAARLFAANADAEAKRLQAVVYERNPALLELEKTRALAGICGRAATCILGGSVMDTWRGAAR